jgi:CDP-diacylglycerol--serine O-phosphatidyltransferase
MKLFTLPNLFTGLNLMCGVIAIVFTFAGRLDIAPWLLLVAAIFDFFDGMLARKMNLSGELGKQLDSLADVVSFGLAPGFIMMVVIVLSLHGDAPFYINDFASNAHFELQNWMNAVFYNVPNSLQYASLYVPFIALLIPFFSMFRLAKFNIDERQSDAFIGVPTPLNTIFFMFFPFVLQSEFSAIQLYPSSYSWLLNEYILSGIVLLMSFLLISELPLISLKFKHFRWRGNEYRYSFLIVSCILIFSLFVWSIPLIVFLYLIISLIEVRIKKNKQNEIQS